VNNTEKLDDIRRRLLRIETRLTIVQRVNVIIFERTTGRAFPPSWTVTEVERKIIGDEDAVSDDEFWKHLTTQYSQS
jgi:hypothetical protein